MRQDKGAQLHQKAYSQQRCIKIQVSTNARNAKKALTSAQILPTGHLFYAL